jgi:hypothetical protein
MRLPPNVPVMSRTMLDIRLSLSYHVIYVTVYMRKIAYVLESKITYHAMKL